MNEIQDTGGHPVPGEVMGTGALAGGLGSAHAIMAYVGQQLRGSS